jgi:hypothetical protein
VGGRLHIIDVNTGLDTVDPVPNMRQPDFRSDGQQIVANGEGGGFDDLWTIDANTGALIRPQGTNHADDFRPSWSQGGTQIVYDSLHMGKGKFNLFTTVLDSRYDEFLFTGSMAIIGTSPVWMHDDWIAFSGCDYWVPKERGGGANCGIYRMPSWSGLPQLIKRGDLTMRATDGYGSQLLLMSQETGNWEIYLMSNQGGEARNLTDSLGYLDCQPGWHRIDKAVQPARHRYPDRGLDRGTSLLGTLSHDHHHCRTRAWRPPSPDSRGMGSARPG